MQIPENIVALIDKCLSGKATPEEKELLNKWYHSFNDAAVDVRLTSMQNEDQIAERIKLRLLSTVQNSTVAKAERPHRIWWRIPAAAAVFLLIASSIFFIFNPKNKKQELAKTELNRPTPVNDIAPGGNKAVLTLADGSSIVLDSAANGTLTQQGNIKVQKLDNGQLAYTVNGKQVTENDEAFYNTISTPRGGQYQVTLADGTQVWLNAASSIRFPVVFTGAERKVEITGEVYFEVSKNAAIPFKVKTAASEVVVLGTHFIVNAYDDEAAVKTTLLEGSVKIIAAGQPIKYLQPGQQSAINKQGTITVLNNADIEEALAWKNGRFQFNSADLKSILRQISRWYDVDVVYKGNVNLHFTGQLTRNDNVSKVFEELVLTGEVHFKIEGKKIIVTE
jgi:ferric-dicitrate binding protein FerR (iron transport regulator)